MFVQLLSPPPMCESITRVAHMVASCLFGITSSIVSIQTKQMLVKYAGEFLHRSPPGRQALVSAFQFQTLNLHQPFTLGVTLEHAGLPCCWLVNFSSSFALFEIRRNSSTFLWRRTHKKPSESDELRHQRVDRNDRVACEFVRDFVS